jgi:uncharacterized cupin superfamily protein
VTEARLEDSGSGLAHVGEGWFVSNVRNARWISSDTFGSVCRFDSQNAWFQQVGINLRVLEPGQPNCLYHSESQQEGVLVLSEECKLLVDGEERLLRQWDFFHCPAGTEHVCIGAGDGPCVILMVGARKEDGEIIYPVSELAARYSASVEAETPNPKDAYAPFEPPQPVKPSSWEQLPWT